MVVLTGIYRWKITLYRQRIANNDAWRKEMESNQPGVLPVD
jgi:hypothetical protein